MQSNGGLVAPEAFRACNAVLSGPAGGLVATARVAEARPPALIAFDMGGTSTGLSRYRRRAAAALRDAGRRACGLQAPMMNIHTVAAGGGSMLAYEGGRLLVGPAVCRLAARALPAIATGAADGDRRAGAARPHPRDSFPAIFRPEGQEPLDEAVPCGEKFDALADAVAAATALPPIRCNSPPDSSTSRSSRWRARSATCPCAKATIRPSSPSSATAARRRSMPAVSPTRSASANPHSSARGRVLRLGHRPRRSPALAQADSRTGTRRGDARELEAAFEAIAAPLVEAMVAQGARPAEVRLRRSLELRAPGTETALDIPQGPLAEVTQGFRTESRGVSALRRLARRHWSRRCASRLWSQASAMPRICRRGAASPARVRAWFDGWRDVPLVDRERSRRARRSMGPPSSSSRTRRRSSSPAGPPSAWPTACSGWHGASGGAVSAVDARHADPRSSSSSITASCRSRADGCGAAGDGRVGQHP
jgi:5-oxoprolinase (ATP-hydrolysing)